MKHAVAMMRSFTVLLAIALLGGCGESSQESPVYSGMHADRPENPQGLRELNIRNHGSVKGRSACSGAVAMRGRSAGSINFTAQCLALAKGGAIDLVVLWNPVGGQGHSAKIVRYGHRLRVSGPGAGSPHSACSLRQQALECSAKARGHIEVAGHFSVPLGTACSAEVSMVNVMVASCRGKSCEGSPVLDELFHGRPRGCPQ
jgi:hypothetical protein